MRSALWSALLCGVGMSAAAQQRTVTFEEPSPVAITGFAVGRADYRRVSCTYPRAGKLAGVQVHYAAWPRVDVWGVVANGWDVKVDNNRGKTGLGRMQVIPIPWVTLGFTGAYGPERDSSDATQRSLFSSDLTIDRGRLIVGAEANFGRDQQSGGNPSWRAAAVTAFLKMSRQVGLTARYDQMEDPDGLLTGTPQILRSVTVGPMWYFSTAREGVFSNIEHTRFHLPQIALRAAVRADWSSAPFFTDASGALQSSNTKGVLELVYVF